MQLKSIVLETLAVGDVLVGRNPAAGKSVAPKLFIVQGIATEQLMLAPFAATFGDDDTEDFGSGEIQVSKLNAAEILAKPKLETGDQLLHRERPAIIIETKEHDWHVKIRYSDAPGGEFYGNLIWMDLSPTFAALDLEKVWPHPAPQ
jgi:hypothetical protein